jgi:hypothetical protein
MNYVKPKYVAKDKGKGKGKGKFHLVTGPEGE